MELTPNQLVAYNLKRARELRGWTQTEAAEELEPYLGVRWSKSTFSTAERSITGDRIRKFDADDIVAFALAFELPVMWFVTVPPKDSDVFVRLQDSEITALLSRDPYEIVLET